MVKIIKEQEFINVKSDYNARFVKLAKTINGKWKSPYWQFPVENEERVRELCLKIYGDNGLSFDTVDLIIDLNIADGLNVDNAIKIGDVVLCERKCRDWQVKIADNVTVIAGEFYDCGGSAKYPRVTWNYDDEMRIKVKNFPLSLYEKIEDKKGITATKGVTNLEALLKEKEAILKRLAEIEKMLGDEKNA